MKNLHGVIFGYDPGGNGNHGVAVLKIQDSQIIGYEVDTKETSQEVIDWFNKRIPSDKKAFLGIGVDTLTCWSLIKSGHRLADILLRIVYDEVKNSVISPNGIYSSMSINGMAVLMKLKEENEELKITETHPKVLFYDLTGEKYNWSRIKNQMLEFLKDKLNLPSLDLNNDHEFDALFSAWCSFMGLKTNWTYDLHGDDEDSISPLGKTYFYWPW